MKPDRRYDPKKRAAAGRVAARRMLELYGYHFPPGACSAGGKRSAHNRWHVQREKINPQCAYCIASEYPRLFEET
jgi:hypothetical protein